MAGVVESIGDSDGVRRGQSTHGKARPKPGRQIGISAAITGRRNGPRGPMEETEAVPAVGSSAVRDVLLPGSWHTKIVPVIFILYPLWHFFVACKIIF